ncbi:PREDICTED: substance-P receptor [Pseudopodoces humilis]|nr:PREDICTED: substance-P receptor [Pseudopodoces humilis]
MDESPALSAELEHLNASQNESWANPFVQAPWQVALWAAAYALIVVVAVVGNAVVMWIVLAHKRMRTVTNYLLVNLAFAEASMAALNTVVNFSYAVHNEWYFGHAYCRFHNFFPIAAVFASIYSMTAIALDRYVAIIHPLRPRLSAAATKALVGLIWLLALLLAAPQGYFSVTAELPGRSVCLVEWPEPGGAVSGKTYHFSMTVLLYLLPLLVIGCAYAAVGRTLWASAIPGDSSDRYHEQVSAKRKVVKMMIVVVCTFALCWLPYHVYFTLQYLRPEWYLRRSIQQLYLAVMWLAMSSTMYNPIIYCCLNDRFRLGFKHAFRWCPCVSAGDYEGLELRSARFLHTHGSVSKLSRTDTATVASALGAADEEPDEPGRAERLSLDVTSNGSSRSDSKTVSESFSFYSNTPT